ncbi:MAG: phage terminase large subunit [Planctomycetes bacterium]|nr:phage terminase large subunit [Planctomycetota bacterium]
MGRILLPQPLPHQLDVLRHPARLKVVVCGRRWGKSLLGLIACVEGHGPPDSGYRGALEGATTWWLAPTYPQGQLIWTDLKKALRGGWTEKSEKQMRITLPGGGSVTVKSADNPDALRGVGLDGVVLDEAAFFSEEAWVNAIRPALADRQGWAIVLTTPNGMNWIASLFESAATSEGWARWQRPTSENPMIPAKELEAARRDMGELMFAQEHLAEFVTAGAGMMKPEWLEQRYEPYGPDHWRLPDGTKITRNSVGAFATVDLAVSTKTTADYTVIAVVGRTPDGRLLLLHVDRARREGPDIVPAIRAVMERHLVRVVWIERTAFQLSIIQEARRRGIPVRELRPDRDKISRAMPLTAALEGGRLLLPRRATWEQEVVHELLAFPLGRHDDVVDALAYAVEAGRSGGSLLDWKTREPADDRDRPVERNAHGFAPFSLGLTFPGQPGHGRRSPGARRRSPW